MNSERNPFGGAETFWLNRALAGTLATFAEYVNEELDEVRGEQQRQRTDFDTLAAREAALQGRDAARAEADQAIAQMAAQAADCSQKADVALQQAREVAMESRDQHVAAHASCPPGLPAASSRALKPEELRLASISHLAWNTPAAELQRRAKEVLALCHVQEASYEWLAPCVGRQQTGSAVQLLFKEQSTIWRARGAMRSLRKEFELGRQCWLDRQKTMEELRPSRLLHRAFGVISEFEKGHAEPEH